AKRPSGVLLHLRRKQPPAHCQRARAPKALNPALGDYRVVEGVRDSIRDFIRSRLAWSVLLAIGRIRIGDRNFKGPRKSMSPARTTLVPPFSGAKVQVRVYVYGSRLLVTKRVLG